MSKIKHLLSSAKCSDYYFINQCTVKLSLPVCISPVAYILFKDDVIDVINYYIDRIKVYFDVEPRCSHMNYHAFEMYDLVPYLYTLLNFYLSLYNRSGVTYERYLPELKLTRSCHLPFEDEILFKDKPLLIVDYAILPDPLTGHYRCFCQVNNHFYCSEDVPTLISDIRSVDPDIFNLYRVHFENSDPRA